MTVHKERERGELVIFMYVHVPVGNSVIVVNSLCAVTSRSSIPGCGGMIYVCTY